MGSTTGPIVCHCHIASSPNCVAPGSPRETESCKLCLAGRAIVLCEKHAHQGFISSRPPRTATCDGYNDSLIKFETSLTTMSVWVRSSVFRLSSGLVNNYSCLFSSHEALCEFETSERFRVPSQWRQTDRYSAVSASACFPNADHPA